MTRPGKMSEEMQAQVGALLDERLSYRKIQNITGVGVGTIMRYNRSRPLGPPIDDTPSPEMVKAARSLEHHFARYEHYRSKPTYEAWQRAQQAYSDVREAAQAERKEAA